MNMSDIQCFLRVAELMSFSKAAEEMYVSQQAVSLHIRRLESTYNVRLFERRPSLKLTEEGRLLLEAANDVIRREELLVNHFSLAREEYHGEIVIGLPPNRSTAFITEFLPEFAKLYPNMTVRLDERTTSRLYSVLKSNEIDFALPILSPYSETLDSRFFVSVELATENQYVVISDQLLREHFGSAYPSCVKKFGRGVSLLTFANLPLFLHPSSSGLHEAIVNEIVQNNIKPYLRVKTTLTSSLLQLCAQGLGVFFSNPMLLKYLYATQPECFRNLYVFPLTEFKGERKSVLLYHKQKLLTKPLTDTIDIIRSIYHSHDNAVKEIVGRKKT